jgi:2-oxoglutarate/2-oxoacid ferredoxin oxidoreductase subunit beta
LSTVQDWTSNAETTWCPGCGNHSILTALRQALVSARLEPANVVIVAGIGQAGKTAHYLGGNFLHGLHGRTLAHALGVKLANHRLKVIAIGGDGDIYGEGGSHLMMAFRRNPDITCFVHNNGVYGLTKGQASPTSGSGFATKAHPEGTLMPAFNPLAAGLAMSATFLARGFAGDPRQLSKLMVEALRHKGFGFLDILQPCVTYNKVNTFQWYKERVRDVAPEQRNPADAAVARRLAPEWPSAVAPADVKSIPVGLLYKSSRPVYEDGFPTLKGGPLVDSRFDGERLRRAIGELL